MPELGELLRKAREDKGLSLAQVEEATKIRHAYLQALEEEDFDRLPAPVYVKGFLKNYALFLGLDPQSTTQLYQPVLAKTVAAPVFLDEPLRPHRAETRLARWIGLVLIVVALASMAWWAYGQWGDQLNLLWPFARPIPSPTATQTATATLRPITPTATSVPPTPTELPTSTPTHTPSPGVFTSLELRIDVSGERAWLMVEVDDQPVFAGILEPGASNTWTARERIVLRCGNAGAVRVILNGADLGLLGAAGQVVDQEWVVPGVPTRTPSASPGA
jgi:cytoskeletal protein RodZ